MKRVIVVVLLLLLAGCSAPQNPQTTTEAPTETPDETVVHTPSNNSSDADYVFGEKQTNGIRPQIIEVSNFRDEGEVSVTVYMYIATNPPRKSFSIRPGETVVIKLNTPTKYGVELSGVVEEQFVIKEDSFDCNYKKHKIAVTDEGVEKTVLSTLLVCPDDTTVTSPDG